MSTPADSHYRCVADQRRREVLSYLRESEATTESLDDLVDYVVAQETHSPSPDRKTVTIDLYHRHLPLLADAGVVDFDHRTETVRYDGHRQVERLLDDRTRAEPNAETEQD